ncbi:MAG: hypothetical protein F2667_14900 [Actinobacteria bacterium]|uniref:Unannotated protein n=1 Tax=freshwater metagenome TaxID=449393 RepID=A0A6J6SKE1_9ZZZZ|nr:hypothetical protein [Actinomycetota bacterium]
MNVALRQISRLSALARGFVLVALLAPVLWTRDMAALWALLAIGVVWSLAYVVESRPGALVGLAASEAALVSAISAVALHSSTAVVGALAVPPFTAGLRHGLRGVALSVSAALATLVAISFLVFDQLTSDQSLAVFTWTVTGVGLGLVACFVHSAIVRSQDPLTPYYNAQSLIRELIDLSGGLSFGLDPNALGGVILSAVRDEVPTSGLVLLVPRGDELAPMLSKDLGATIDPAVSDEIAARCFVQGRPIVEGVVFAIPLLTDNGCVGVVVGMISEQFDQGDITLADRVRLLTRTQQGTAVRLDTALLFARFRDAATADERRRLSREMHDGVAQDIASLGYLVDAIAARPANPEQAERIEFLRERVTAIVAEVRRSVITLRTTVGSSESLGAAISSIARNLSEVSGVPIEVTLDEHTSRLRPEVEGELFRIGQEAINNAVKHSECTTVRVHCQVHAPSASITVTDDGRGMGPGRPDSFGLGIMQERARLIDGILTMEETPGGGLTVAVHLNDSPGPRTAASTDEARVTA